MIELVSQIARDVEAWILALTSSWWVFVALFALCTIDGFFPPVPSESIVITLAVTAHTTGAPNIWLVLVVAMAGAWCGDQIAFSLGRWIGTDRIPWLRSDRGRRTIERAERAIAHRGASFILGARYVPIGRVAVNMTAGAVGYKRERFVAVTAVAAVMWAVYSVLIGLAAATWLGHSTLLAMAVGVVGGVVTGVAIDRIMAWVARRRAARAEEPATVTASEAAPVGSSGAHPS
ncbi:DedA family protein [Sanguibacter sp. HDW7]|uniref:DedA family protein n=1 Tax=Sanguibacter sp. HDW7 TaxID=2714931 RepID=UPI001407BF5F|nr:DedA family protein [Sanguibacter sp. HDW7]QIK82765.1 DedA family protein [Sanguibacter sp. HDW7]